MPFLCKFRRLDNWHGSCIYKYSTSSTFYKMGDLMKFHLGRTANSRERITRKVEFCPVFLKHNGKIVAGYLLDISREGAKIRSAGQQKEPGFGSHDELELDIKTPYGISSCKGKVQWSEEADNGYRWGVQFTEISKQPSDPIRCLIDSALC